MNERMRLVVSVVFSFVFALTFVFGIALEVTADEIQCCNACSAPCIGYVSGYEYHNICKLVEDTTWTCYFGPPSCACP